jgi:ribosomal protein S12 methylthiotransferase accessory factor
MHFSAAGASIDRQEALYRALGETVERHASMHAFDRAEQVMMPFAATSLADRFPRCAPDEAAPPMFRGQNWDAPISHVRMQQVANGAEVDVPAPYVHLGYMAPSDEFLATYPVSTGIAFSPDRVQALWRGLCEVAERDALMLFWLTRSGFRRIDARTGRASTALARRLDRLDEVDLTWTLVDISTDFPVPVVFAVVAGREYPYLTVGASCQTSLDQACCKALDEAVSVRASLRHDKWKKPVVDIEDFGWVKRLEDHMVLYGSWPDSQVMDFLQESEVVDLHAARSGQVTEPPASGMELAGFAAHLRAELEVTVLACDLECADTAPFGHVVRVVVPEMMPLSQDHHARWLETPRLLRRLASAGHDINPFPHPFA